MDASGVRMNGVKEKEQRLKRMQIELGRARLVARPLELLQQPVSIIPPSDPDPDPDDLDPDPDPDPELGSKVADVPCLEQSGVENRGCDSGEVTGAELLVDLDPLNTNPFRVSGASGDTQDRAHPSSNPFRDGHDSEFPSSNPFIDANKSAFPSSNPFADSQSTEFSACSVNDASENAAVEVVKDAFMNPFSQIPSDTSCEDIVDNSDSVLDMHASTILSPISEESAFPSMTSVKDGSGKDSGYCVTSMESLSSVTSPDSEGNDLVWKASSAGVAGSTSDTAIGDKVDVDSKSDCFIHGTEDSKPDVQVNNNTSSVNVSGEELISFADRELPETDKTKRLEDEGHYQPDSLFDKDPPSADPKAREVQNTNCSQPSLNNMDTGDKLSSEDTTGDDTTYIAYSDIDSDFVSNTGGLETDDDASDAAVSETDAEFQSNAVGLLVEVYGMDKDELCGSDLGEIPEETVSELEAVTGSEVSEVTLAADSPDLYGGRVAARGMLKKEPNIEVNSFDEQESIPDGDSQEPRDLCGKLNRSSQHNSDVGSRPSGMTSYQHDSQTVLDVMPVTDHALCNSSSSPAGNLQETVMMQTPYAQEATKGVLLDSQQDSVMARSVRESQSFHFIDNLEFPMPQ